MRHLLVIVRFRVLLPAISLVQGTGQVRLAPDLVEESGQTRIGDVTQQPGPKESDAPRVKLSQTEGALIDFLVDEAINEWLKTT
jgi:hypothetical protein